MDESIGIVGLGLMGTAIAERLLAHHYRVVVWNRTREKSESLLRLGATWSDNPFVDCDCVLISLYSTDVVRDVLQQMQDGMRAGQIVIDTTTGEPDAAVRLAQELKEQGIIYLDAPVSGSSEQTRSGDATLFVAGDQRTYERLEPLWRVLGRAVFYVGENGAASQMKLVSNLVLGLNRAALAEGLIFAKRMGIDPMQALTILRSSAAYSRVMDIKGDKMVTRDFRVQARLSQHLKDVRIILQKANQLNQLLPLTETHRSILERAEEAGWGDADNSAVINAYEESRDE
ncbi:NAD(P)-dependent oxidoreductase [bacterium]|nr:NAD(P)-dependent oxidoreductase [bacterium]